MARSIPILIPDDWKPSIALCRWAQQMYINKDKFEKCLFDFVLWHTEKQVRRANFNLAFRNWLKKELQIDATRMKPASFSTWNGKPVHNVADRSSALQHIKKMKGMI